ncbi:ABC transporter permease [Vagococcus fluvialis]|uniref:ABC transporter permease n=1 Tax=Vagococcus fluvialis TaxID=2738 RepID=UPI003B59F4B3
MNKFWVVALETYKKHVKSVSFVMMIIAPILMLGFVYGGGYMNSKFSELNNISVISESKDIQSAFVEQTKKDFKIDNKIKTKEEAEKALANEKIDGYLIISLNDNGLEANYTGVKSLGTTDSAVIQQNLNQLQLGMNTASLDLTEQEVGQLLAPATFSEKQVVIKDGKIEENKSNKAAMVMVSMIVVFTMYMIVMLYSTITAQEVASEKGTRIMEVILSSTTASKHFYGKITGISLVILTQVAVYLVTGLAGFLFVKDIPAVKEFFEVVSPNEILKGLLGYNLLYLLFGVLIYTILSAFMGSLVNKSEDSAKAAAPVTYIIMAGFLPSMMIGMANPQSVLIKIMSFIPFLSSFAMPIRIANYEATNMEILISLGVLVISIVILLKLAAKAYKSTVLVYSDKSMMNVFKDAMKLSK